MRVNFPQDAHLLVRRFGADGDLVRDEDLELAGFLDLLDGHAGMENQQLQALGGLVKTVHAQLGDDAVGAGAGRKPGRFAGAGSGQITGGGDEIQFFDEGTRWTAGASGRWCANKRNPHRWPRRCRAGVLWDGSSRR